MATASANKFWISLSPQSILNGKVGITGSKELPNNFIIKCAVPPFSSNPSIAHPVFPKFGDIYLNVGIRSDYLGDSEYGDTYKYYSDNLRKSVKSDYCIFYYDDDKYTMNLITSAHSTISDVISLTLLSDLLKNKKLYRILDIYITDITKNTQSEQEFDYNIKIRYLEKK